MNLRISRRRDCGIIAEFAAIQSRFVPEKKSRSIDFAPFVRAKSQEGLKNSRNLRKNWGQNTMIFDAKSVLEKIRENSKEKVSKMRKKPKILIIMSGDDEPSERYVRNKCLDFEKIGIEYKVKRVDTISKLLKTIDKANNDEEITGIIVQRPVNVKDVMPGKKLEHGIANWITPTKDIDGARENSPYPTGCVRALDILLAETGFEVSGKTAVVIGRGEVGIPIARRLLSLDATVTVAHSKTDRQELEDLATFSDIVVGAAGLREPVIIKEWAQNVNVGDTIFIDYGITKGENGKLHGDLYRR